MMLVEIPHPCGSAEVGGSPSRLVVSDHAPARRRPASSCSHGRTTWTSTHYTGKAGRSRRSPGTPAGTARPVRAYLTGNRTPGVRARTEDPFAPFVDYVSARLGEDPHLWALTLFDEIQPLGFNQSYQ